MRPCRRLCRPCCLSSRPFALRICMTPEVIGRYDATALGLAAERDGQARRPGPLRQHRRMCSEGVHLVICSPLEHARREEPYGSIACLDGRDSRSGVGPTEELEVHSAGRQQIVDAVLEVTRGDVAVEIRTGTRGLREIPV